MGWLTEGVEDSFETAINELGLDHDESRSWHGAPLQEVESSPALPEAADAVVIGAGVAGAFTAYEFARRGLKVALLEKGRVGAEQSSRNWGWCRQQNRDARELPISTRSLALWEDFARNTGQDTGFRRCGLLYLSDDEAEIAGWARWCAFAATVGLASHVLGPDEASERGRATGRRWRGGVFSPSDGIADPSRAAPAAARAVMALGGTVHQGCAARGLETAGGRVCGVVTEHGPIRTSLVVLAAGAWASSFCHQLGVVFPQAAIRSSILAVSPGGGDVPDALHTKRISVTRRGDGGHTLAISGLARLDLTPGTVRFGRHFAPMFAKRWRSLMPGGLQGLGAGHETRRRWRLDRPTPMERMRILDPRPDSRTVAETHRRAVALLPGLADRHVTAAWAGYIDSTPDGVPAIGPVAAVPGLILSAGFSGHGFGIGPGAGHLAADLATGAAPLVDPRPYDPERFTASAWGKVAEF